MTSEQLYSSALDSIADSVGIFSSVRDESGKVVDFNITYINPAGAESLSRGSPRNALIGTKLLITDPGMKKSGLFDLYLKLVETGEPIQRIFAFDQDKSKPTRHVEIRASKLGDGFVSQW